MKKLEKSVVFIFKIKKGYIIYKILIFLEFYRGKIIGLLISLEYKER